jgi:hypothetical protein
MAKEDDLPRRIEAVFERTGLGNLDPEKLSEFLELYDRAIAETAAARKRTGKKFRDVLESAEPKPPEEEG